MRLSLKTALAWLAFLALVLPAAAQAGWQEFSSREGRFKALFPGTPQESVQTGPSSQLHVYKLLLEKTIYMVGYMDLPGNADTPPESILDSLRDAFTGDSALLGEEAAPLQGQPGRLVRTRSADGSLFFWTRLLWVDKARMYEVVAATKTPETDAANIQKFLGSFALLSEAESNASPSAGSAAPYAQQSRWKQLLDQSIQLYREGKYFEAVPVAEEAVRVAQAAFGPAHSNVADSLNNLARLYRLLGEYAKAEPLYQRALRIDEQALGPDHLDVAISLNNLAALYYDQGKYAEAEPLLVRALRIQQKELRADDLDVANTMSSLAGVYEAQGRYPEAEPLYQSALRAREKALGPDDPQVAVSLGNLASLYGAQGRNAEAEPLYRRALGIQEKVLGAEHPDVAVLLDGLAVLYLEQGKYSQAEPLLQRTLRIWEKALGSDHLQVGSALSNLASLRFAQGQAEAAQPLYARFFDLLFRQFQYQFTYMSERERLGFLATVSGSFPQYFSFVHQYRGKEPDLADHMYDLLLWEKGFIAGSEAALRRQVEASGDPEALKLLDQLAAKRAQLAALLNAQPADREAWRRQIEQMEAEANDLEKALVARSAAFAQQKKLERVTWQQVRAALKPGEAAIEFARFPFFQDGKKWTGTSYYVALVVTPETKEHPQYVVLGEARDLEGAPLVQFQQDVQARGVATATESAVAPGPQAYHLFWEPLEPLLADRTRLYLSADGVLNQMPLGLIPAPDGKLLMERYDLRLLSSTKDLLREEPAAAANTALLIGNPAFDLAEAQQRAALRTMGGPAPPEPAVMAALAVTDRSRDQGSGTTLPPLPGTGAEIQAIDQLLQQHQWQVTSYTSDRALEEAVKQARSPRLLHLATHGFFLADQQLPAGRLLLSPTRPSGLEDPMLRSGLYLAGADRALAGGQAVDDLDDGVLTAYEATSLDLQGTELVVLSACNTGQGEVKNGEGVFGLRRALQEAGAQAVMMSLWSVPDKETQELMTLFYSNWLGGMEKHAALRQAQLEMRARVQQRYGRDLPYYWGAFVLVGR